MSGMVNETQARTRGIRSVVPDALQAVRALYQHELICAGKRDELVRMIVIGMKDADSYRGFADEVLGIAVESGNPALEAECCAIIGRIEDEIYF